MATIRQEINFINAQLVSTSYTPPIIQLDTTQYVNPTYYFEVDAKISAGSGTITLTRKTGGTVDATATVSNGSITRVRTTAFTPPAGQTEYNFALNPGVNTITVNAIRIIIIDNPTTLTNTETQIEIGMNKTGLISTATSPRVVPDSTLTKYWKYTAANWDGTKTFFAEVTYLTASSKSGVTFTLQEDDGTGGGFANFADKVTIVSAGIATTATRVRVSFTPTDGRNYRIAYNVASSKTAGSIFNAKIIVDQVGNGNFNAVSSQPIQGGTATSGQTNQALAQSFQIAKSGTITGVVLSLNKSGSPTDTINIDIVSTRGGSSLANGTISSSSLSTSFAQKVVTFSTPVALNASTTYYIQITRSPDTADATNFISSNFNTNDVYSNGGMSTRANNVWGAESGDIYFALIGVDPITLLEPQYLLLNTADGGTGLQSYQTLVNKTNEWGSQTITGKHAIDSDNASNAGKLVDIDNSNTDVTSSTVTGANQQISADIWGNITDGHQIDVNVTNSTGVVGASRIIVTVQVVAPTVTTSAATGVGTTSATGNGNVTSDGGSAITERGFCWSTSANPTTSDSKVVDGSATTGSYSDTMSPLSSSTTYHYRAYAINSIGTSYGADTQFTTTGGGGGGGSPVGWPILMPGSHFQSPAPY